ncbi:unnamed protein product [Caenorhabditis sp. 36 PRJEB53466]|nr:unnamed protein product [Caenorhabditis sp. 36 PRJEB53466]
MPQQLTSLESDSELDVIAKSNNRFEKRCAEFERQKRGIDKNMRMFETCNLHVKRMVSHTKEKMSRVKEEVDEQLRKTQLFVQDSLALLDSTLDKVDAIWSSSHNSISNRYSTLSIMLPYADCIQKYIETNEITKRKLAELTEAEELLKKNQEGLKRQEDIVSKSLVKTERDIIDQKEELQRQKRFVNNVRKTAEASQKKLAEAREENATEGSIKTEAQEKEAFQLLQASKTDIPQPPSFSKNRHASGEYQLQYARPRVFRDPASFPDLPPKKRRRPRKVNPTEGPAAKRARIKRTFKRFFKTPYEDGFSSQCPSTSSQILRFENLTDNGFKAINITEKKPEFLIHDSPKDVKQEPIDDCEPVRGVQRALPNSFPIAVFNQTAKPRRHVRLMPAPVAQAQKPGNRMPKEKPLPYETVTAHNQRASSSMLQNGTSQSLPSNVFGQKVEAVEKKPDSFLPVEPQEVKQEPIDDYEPVTKANGLSSSWTKDGPKDEQKPNRLHLIKPKAVDGNHALGNLPVAKRSNANECSRTLPFAPSPHKKVPVGQTPDFATATPRNRPQRLRVVKVIRKVGPPSNTPSTGIDANDETKFTQFRLRLSEQESE